MNKYRTHKCNELRKGDIDKNVSLSGWINKKRDHGNLLFIDLRDNYGITQCIIDKENKNFSGKSHLINIFLQNFKGIKISANKITNNFLKEIKIYENVIVEDLFDNIDENLLFTLTNIIEQENKYLIVTSTKPIVEFKFTLQDLNSRANNFLLSVIEKPEDDLMYALILKNLSDRQISIDKKLIDFIIKRITRSYGKISDFIYKIDEISLKRKKPIDFKIIKEALGE